MRSYAGILSIGLVALGALSATVFAQGDGCKNINSISYCRAVDHITYTDIGTSGTYDDVTGMDGETCSCKTAPKKYSGVLAPMNEQISLHFRGPLALKKFAVYYPSGSPQSKRSLERSSHFKRHGRHTRHAGIEAGGEVVDLLKRGPGMLTRTGYYDAAAGVAQGIVFMNHKGGQGSGVFDHCWGNSLSYANSHCNAGSSKPETLADITVPSNEEFVIFSDEKCSGGDCGYYRPGIPAHRGFDGKNKVFLFEFRMPSDGKSGFNGDMPSIWALNAKIPRTAQYASCSCWGSGCGEFDLFEVLQGANDYVKSHYHSSQGAGSNGKGGGGSPDYFKRPYNNAVKAAAVFDDAGTVTVKFLPGNISFGQTINSEDLSSKDSQIPSVYQVPN